MTAPLLWNNWLLPRLALDRRGRTLANAVAASGYALVCDGRPNWISARGFRYGTACAGIVAVGYAAALQIPPVRRALGGPGDRAPDVSTAEWVAVHIPLGTVYPEELIFRATLDPLMKRQFGSRAGAVAGAAVFGLWHIHPAHVAGDNVAGTVVFTAFSGLLFGALAGHAGSVSASALLHWAVNAGGAVLSRRAPLAAAVSPATLSGRTESLSGPTESLSGRTE
ncbi:CPBP family intramembrane glutamic endopeptidase [Nocardia sp. NBC_01329]|uniref:CPBP family intramembrane glutamic endopeptidase n=1 Tax=Nocardia sp. NBC_01329 TaxID=2903594 RepID=UPI002E0D8C83|nr:CPBP family intramembrane metalloprotease [Nocardia sp. NBC_01329]